MEPSQSPTPNESPVLKGRKGIAASGGKSWSEEEEVYLLQMRTQKVAYKIIAIRLEKTELACRLHYHQLSHGGKNRKRTHSFSSSESSSISPNVSYSAPNRPKTPPRSNAKSSSISFQALNSPSPPAEMAIPGPLLTSKNSSKRLKRSLSVDKLKLDGIVQEQSRRMWEDVATLYGEGFSVEELQKAWRKKTSVKRHTVTPSYSPVPSIMTEQLPPPSELLSDNTRIQSRSRSLSEDHEDPREYKLAPLQDPIGSPYSPNKVAFPPMNPSAPVGSPYSTPKTETDEEEDESRAEYGSMRAPEAPVHCV